MIIIIIKFDGNGVPTSPYHSDLAALKFYLISNVKEWLARKKCYSNDNSMLETNVYFNWLDNPIVRIKNLTQRRTKCITQRVELVDKIKVYPEYFLWVQWFIKLPLYVYK